MVTDTLVIEEKIVQAALEEYFRYGLKSVSMDDISRKLGMSKKTLYQYVDNKKELIDKVIDYKIGIERQVFDALAKSTRDAVHEMVQLSEHIIEHFSDVSPSLVMDLMKYYPQLWSKVSSFQMEELKRMIENNIRRGHHEGYYRTNLDPDIIAKLYVSMCFSIDEEKLFPQRQYNRAQVIREVIMYHLEGILSAAGREHSKDFKFFQIIS